MNLILTPTYKSFDIVKRMCDAIDIYTRDPFVHILVDDDSGELLPIPSTQNRRIIQIRRDIPDVIHKNGLGQALQLGYSWAHQQYFNEGRNPVWDNIFVIESDVIVLDDGWDQMQIALKEKLPSDWGTLDVQSVDETGKVTYPCTVSPRHDEWSNCYFELLHYPDFQCTLFNPKVFDMGMSFSDAPSHFDVLFGRKMEQLGMKPYRACNLRVLHVNGGGNSRQFIM